MTLLDANKIELNMERNRTRGAYLVAATCLVVAMQVSFISSYTSTDFEVHRNWMAITHHLPLKKWYYEKTSEWTLDYPPFFAYLEKFLAIIAARILSVDSLEISNEPVMNPSILLFQRFSVIFTHLLYVLVCYYFCFTDNSRWKKLPPEMRKRSQIALFILLISNVGLILVDAIHFQYNGFLTSLLLLSMTFMDSGYYLKGAFIFCALLNFKHIYLYYAPAFAAYYLLNYFELSSKSTLIVLARKGALLLLVMLVPFGLAFGPFMATGGVASIMQIILRLFPVHRGLTHAYWAPNFWAIYNFTDLCLYRFMNLLGMKLSLPTYTSGLVQEYSHSVLPSVNTTGTLTCTMASLIPLFLLLRRAKQTDFAVYLTLSAFSFFLFGYHVHEKAIMTVTIPLTVAAFTNPIYLRPWIILNAIATTSLFPLLFTQFEMPTKYALGCTYFFLGCLCVHRVFLIRIRQLISTSIGIYFAGLGFVELYNTMIHQLIFGDRFAFLPLMLISIYNAVGTFYVYMLLLSHSFRNE